LSLRKKSLFLQLNAKTVKKRFIRLYTILKREQTFPNFIKFIGAHFKKGGIFLALKGRNIPAQGNALGNTLQ